MTENNTAQKAEKAVLSAYDDRVHRVGRITMALMTVTMFLPIAVPAIVYGASVEWRDVLAATLAILTVFGVNGLIEPFAFAPILGAGATYIAFTTGNVSQTKVPCVVTSQKIMNVEMGTPEGDVVATLAAGVCSLVTTLEVALGMIFVNVVYGFLTSPAVKPGFDNIVPAMMGALSVMFIAKSPKVGFLPYVLYAGFLLAVGVQFNRDYGVWAMLTLIVVTVLWAYILHRKKAAKAD